MMEKSHLKSSLYTAEFPKNSHSKVMAIPKSNSHSKVMAIPKSNGHSKVKASQK